jgi:hypothetical protein
MAQITIIKEKPDRYELYNLYKVMKLRVKEIAARIGYSTSEVGRLLQDYNIPSNIDVSNRKLTELRRRQNRGAHFDTLVDMFTVWMRNSNYNLEEIVVAAYVSDGILQAEAEAAKVKVDRCRKGSTKIGKGYQSLRD